MSKVFLDTNVLIYSVDKDSPDKRDDALTLLKQIGHSGSTVLSTQVLQEFYSAATGKLHIPSEDARMLLVKFTVFEVVQVTTERILRAVDISAFHHLSFWDSLIISTAEVARCETLLTEDMNDGQIIEGVRIVNPFA